MNNYNVDNDLDKILTELDREFNKKKNKYKLIFIFAIVSIGLLINTFLLIFFLNFAYNKYGWFQNYNDYEKNIFSTGIPDYDYSLFLPKNMHLEKKDNWLEIADDNETTIAIQYEIIKRNSNFNRIGKHNSNILNFDCKNMYLNEIYDFDNSTVIYQYEDLYILSFSVFYDQELYVYNFLVVKSIDKNVLFQICRSFRKNI